MNTSTSRSGHGRAHRSRDLEQEFQAKELARRRALASAVPVGAMAAPVKVGGAGPSPQGGTSGAGGDGAAAKHLVGMGYHAADPISALRAALEETDGLSAIRSGDSVYLRVNSNSGDPYPYSTSPEALIAIGQMLKDKGVSDIRIGDRSFWGDPDTAGNLKRNGITAAAKKLGTAAIVFDDTVDWVVLPPGTLPNWKGTVRIPEPVATATHFINMACVKTHFIAHITMCLKLCLGLVHADDRRRPGNLDNHVQARLWDQIAEVNKHITPSLNVLDGYKAVITGGPTVHDQPPGAPANWHAATGEPKVYIVSTDRIAADVVGAAVLRTLSPAYEEVNHHPPFKLPQVRAAIKAGLGISGPEALDLSGPTVPLIETYRQHATTV